MAHWLPFRYKWWTEKIRTAAWSMLGDLQTIHSVPNGRMVFSILGKLQVQILMFLMFLICTLSFQSDDMVYQRCSPFAPYSLRCAAKYKKKHDFENHSTLSIKLTVHQKEHGGLLVCGVLEHRHPDKKSLQYNNHKKKQTNKQKQGRCLSQNSKILHNQQLPCKEEESAVIFKLMLL